MLWQLWIHSCISSGSKKIRTHTTANKSFDWWSNDNCFFWRITLSKLLNFDKVVDLSVPSMIEPYGIVVPWPKEESYLLAPIRPFQSMVCVTSSSYLPSIHECVMCTTESTDIIVSPYIYNNTFFFHSPAFSPHSSIIGHTHTQCILIYQTALSSVSCYNTYNDERELER